jgi:hypothetical protein
MISAIAAFQIAQKTGDSGLLKFSSRPEIQREVENFKATVKSAKSADDLLKDHRALSFMLTAHNLSAEIDYPGKARRILTESPSNKDALMFKLDDKRYQNLANGTKFADKGLDYIKLPIAQERLTEGFIKAKYEESLGDLNGAVPLARYFAANIGTAEDAYDILSDAKLRKAAMTIFNLPEQIALQPVESQAALIEGRIDFKQLSNPDYVSKLTNRFLALSDVSASSGAGNPNSYLLNLFA